MKEKYMITGMTCSACSARVDKCVRKLDGVKDVNVNLLTNSMSVVYDESVLNPDTIVGAVTDAGYGAYLDQPAAAALLLGYGARQKARCAGRANEEHEAPPYRIVCFFNSTHVYLYGLHGGAAAARLFRRHGRRGGLWINAVSSVPSHYLC